MAELFTDGTDVNFGSDPEITLEPAVEPTPTVVPTATPLPVQDQQDSMADKTDTAGDPSAVSGKEVSEGVEEVPAADTVDYETYLEQLIQQNEKQNELLQTLIKEDKQLDQDMKSVQNAMPAVMCMLGVIIGLLLLQILASYIRP